ncbi:unnamed protein product [Rotaria socialis]|uniref:Uncharacterized protein n=2 Tax=Rotaria socialis TaxID=392032 RepID=A0A818B2L0_9BILA|nr:unnamed protein product [Rotaria socialis]
MTKNPVINKNNNDINEHINYRQPMYLTRSSSILYEILNKTLNYSLKKKDEKQFINVRLQLLDQQYCLEKDRQLWQSYLDIGLQQHLWPNEYIDRLISIREKQAEIWKEQLMLEIRIHCKFLPQNFNHLEDFISSIGYLPLNNNAKVIEIKNKRFKIIQEAKRHWLNYFLNIYEIKIREYEQQYQNEFIKLESLFSNNNDNMINDTTM